ncbi:MAG: type II toxin-antitoxin system RelE family toxin [Candidatus Woesearchaeota archaeon]
MPKYELLETENFSKAFSKLTKEIQKRFDCQFRKLLTDPFSIGDPIHGRRWFREIKNQKYRAYYMIFEDKVIIVLVGISEKKNQQKIIDFILRNVDKMASNTSDQQKS